MKCQWLFLAENDTEDQQLLDEEKDIVSSLVLLIPDICSPGEWVPMEKLHSEVCRGRIIHFCTDSWNSKRNKTLWKYAVILTSKSFLISLTSKYWLTSCYCWVKLDIIEC